MDARLANARRPVFLTGAGISVASGLPTYRGPEGLYDTGTVPPLHVRDTVKERIWKLWAHIDALKAASDTATPNAAHQAIAAYAAADPARTVTVLTQNIDGLHERAGGPVTVLPLHGTLQTVRCTGRAHPYDWHAPPRDDENVPRCPQCNSPCRPNVTLFGEPLDRRVWKAARQAVTDADILVVVGTSLEVHPACTLVDHAQERRTPVLHVNPQHSTALGVEDHLGPADQVLPALLA